MALVSIILTAAHIWFWGAVSQVVQGLTSKMVLKNCALVTNKTTLHSASQKPEQLLLGGAGCTEEDRK